MEGGNVLSEDERDPAEARDGRRTFVVTILTTAATSRHLPKALAQRTRVVKRVTVELREFGASEERTEDVLVHVALHDHSGAVASAADVSQRRRVGARDHRRLRAGSRPRGKGDEAVSARACSAPRAVFGGGTSVALFSFPLRLPLPLLSLLSLLSLLRDRARRAGRGLHARALAGDVRGHLAGDIEDAGAVPAAVIDARA